MEILQKAIYRTLVYADVFNYPLTIQEVFKFLISPTKPDKKTVQKTLAWMSADWKLIHADNIYYCLGGRQKIIHLRKKKESLSKKKLKIAQRVAGWLKPVPWIKMMGITGGLAILNSDKDDDIDILIVSAKNRLWLTRLWVTIMVGLVAKRRRPAETQVRDKICLNMFLDEDHLTVPEKEQDLYSAHEVVQMRPLWDKNETYQKFLWKNQWVNKFLPNGTDTKVLGYDNTKRESKNLLSISISQCLNIFESLARSFQLWYMCHRRTSEVIYEGIIRFHPQDARVWVLRQYEARLKKLRLHES